MAGWAQMTEAAIVREPTPGLIGNNGSRRPSALHDYRCTCNRLIFRARLNAPVWIEARCPKCGRMCVWRVLDESDTI